MLDLIDDKGTFEIMKVVDCLKSEFGKEATLTISANEDRVIISLDVVLRGEKVSVSIAAVGLCLRNMNTEVIMSEIRNLCRRMRKKIYQASTRFSKGVIL
jgi:hypothetical protein